MRLAIIDASPVGGGPVTHALTHAAAEMPDAQVTRVRTFDLFARVCSSCMACAGSGRCTRHHDAIEAAIARLGSADALLVGCSGHLHARDPRCQALLERLVGAFGHIETARGLSTAPAAAHARKRAALVFGAPPLMGVVWMLGMLPSGATGVWRMLERADTAVVGCATVGARWAGPASRDRASQSARRIGRSLAHPAAERAATLRGVPAARRAATALLGAVRGV
jgi:hypothetical protein